MREISKRSQDDLLDQSAYPEVPPAPVQEKVSEREDISPVSSKDNKQRRDQRELSKQRKEFFERKYLQEQPQEQLEDVKSARVAPEAKKPSVKLTKKEREEKDLLQKELARQRMQVENQRKQLQQHMQQQAKVMYDQAMRYYQQNDYARAKQSFNAAQELVPNYKDTQRYLNKINQQQSMPAKEIPENIPSKKSKSRLETIEASLDQFDPNVQ
jgi:uncharacterized membrane-anchored protein YhcB (DUF1043 family)